MFKIHVDSDAGERTFVAPSDLSEGMVFSVGRDPGCEIVLARDHISSNHGEFVFHNDRLYFRDLRSTNGTILRRDGALVTLGEQQGWAMQLQHGDVVLLGTLKEAMPLRIEIDDAVVEALKIADRDTTILALTHLNTARALEGRLSQDPRWGTRLYRASKIMAASLNLREVCESSCAAIFDLLPIATNISVLLDRHPVSTAAPSGRSVDPNDFVPFLTLDREGNPAAGERPSRQVVAAINAQKAGVLVVDTADFNPSQSILRAQIRSIVAVPLAIGERIFGIIQVDNRSSQGAFIQDDLEALVVLAQQMALGIENARLFQRVSVAEARLKDENQFLKTKETSGFSHIIGESPLMKRVFELVDRVVDTAATVLITGETGTGKEVVARLIHDKSRRRDKLFVAQNCSALPENLLESELFGHKKGSFTGADVDKKGLFELAHNGTMFLDEIGETSAAMQAKLLRVLQEGEVRPVGAPYPKKVDVRVIAATNRELEQEVAEGRFREDLYYRLNVFPILLPPLRDRQEDIPLLADHYLKRFSREFNRPALSFSPETTALMQSYRWPGNIRELQNEIQRLVIHGVVGDFLLPEHLASRISRASGLLQKVNPVKGGLKDMLDEVERWILIESLREHEGNKTRAAVALQITREGLHKKLSRFGL